MKRIIALLVVITSIIGVLAVAPTVFLPKRWLNIHVGDSRSDVHNMLGKPDIDFYYFKSFDEWHNSFGYGASVIDVSYDDNANVSWVRIKTSWGRSFKKWDEYKAK